ncbi:class I SAM-dependent methyltransferase [Pseudomonas sp. HR96]|uniref:class I SAM-dependent methyltransferase n=1 Tax=Pseudomonas sp. HR96 TaxID=1027966 RepID=UPI002A74E75F|nr:class I SAM-dependent methyltransferase [Pseudomonas sp. HR96]WPO98070.1 class I SAM-dependent methyltransferase [Pseudomonas sp. HR96]
MGNPAQLNLSTSCPPAASPVSGWAARRELKLARKALALAGDPGLVLDLPCGTGRFWPLLAGKPSRVVIAADDSLDALERALGAHGGEVLARVRPLHTELARIELSDNAVDSIFCMDGLQQLEDPARRLALLREFYRVSRDTLIVALWREPPHKAAAARLRGEAEAQFRQAGFKIEARLDLLALWSMARVYLLRKP